MSIEDALYTRATGFSGLDNLISGRFYPVKLKENAAMPACVYTRVSGIREHAMGSDPGIVTARFQVACFDDDYEGLKDLTAQAILAFSRWNGTVSSVTVDETFLENEIDLYDDETKKWQTVVDFTVHYRE